MVFFNVLFRTLGFLVGITIFIILLNILFYFLPENREEFSIVEGEESSNNIIVTLDLSGPIINNANKSFAGNLFEYIDPEKVKKYLSKLEKINPQILIININSPGGTVTATSSLEKTVNNFKNKSNTEVYFYSNEILASGGYWVATSGDKIFANYGSIIGSIGVSGPSWYYFDKPTSISDGLLGQRIETENGIQIFDQNAGNSKDLYNPFRKPTSKELKHLQNIVKDIYNDFLIKVSNSRKIEINVVKNEIGALIYNSKQAKENFLIDEVLDYDELIKKILINKNIKDYKILKINIKNNFFKKYLTNYLNLNYNFVCNKLKINFVSVLPLYLNNC